MQTAHPVHFLAQPNGQVAHREQLPAVMDVYFPQAHERFPGKAHLRDVVAQVLAEQVLGEVIVPSRYRGVRSEQGGSPHELLGDRIGQVIVL